MGYRYANIKLFSAYAIIETKRLKIQVGKRNPFGAGRGDICTNLWEMYAYELLLWNRLIDRPVNNYIEVS